MKHNYKLSPKDDYAGGEQSIIREEDGAWIPLEKENRDLLDTTLEIQRLSDEITDMELRSDEEKSPGAADQEAGGRPQPRDRVHQLL